MLDALRRGRLHPQMRGARYVDIPGFRHPPDCCAARAQCQDIAGAAQFKIRSRSAARSDAAGLIGLISPPSLRGDNAIQLFCMAMDRFAEACHLRAIRWSAMTNSWTRNSDI